MDAAAIADTIALAGIVAITARAGTAGRFAVVCAVTGFVLAPAAGAVTALTGSTQSTAETGGALLAAALCGAGVALLPKRPHPRALTAAGLAGGVALALTCIGRRRKDVGPEAGPISGPISGPQAAAAAGPGAGPGNVTGAPVPGAGAMPDHG